VPQTYRICRAEDGDLVLDLRSMLRSVFGMGRPVAAPAPRQPDGSICYVAIANRRMVGSMTLRRPDAPASGDSGWHADVATLQRLDVDADHQDSGCREALLDVAMQWAGANDYSALEVTVPAAPADGADFYLVNGFHIIGKTHEPGSDAPAIVLSLRLAGARPHSDAWYSKHHGAWFASVVRH